MTAASLVLYLVFTASRPWPWRAASAAAPPRCFTGLYLALGPRFLTVFSLNCVGQYVDVLALGGVALALLARVLDEEARGAPARGRLPRDRRPAGGGVLAAAGGPLVRRGRGGGPGAARRDVARSVDAARPRRRRCWARCPSLLWNIRQGWASRDILGREPLELRAQAEALPHLIGRTLSVSFPILSGLSPEPSLGGRARRARGGGLAPATAPRGVPGRAPEGLRGVGAARAALPRRAGAAAHDALPRALLGRGLRQRVPAPALPAAAGGRERGPRGRALCVAPGPLAGGGGRGAGPGARPARRGHAAAPSGQRATSPAITRPSYGPWSGRGSAPATRTSRSQRP